MGSIQLIGILWDGSTRRLAIFRQIIICKIRFLLVLTNKIINEKATAKTYNARAKLNHTLLNETRTPVNYRVARDCRNESGHIVATGMYWYQIMTGG